MLSDYPVFQTRVLSSPKFFSPQSQPGTMISRHITFVDTLSLTVNGNNSILLS